MTPNQHNHARRAPLSAHPLFPAIVGLWLCAVLAIAALAVPTSLLERAAAVTRLDLLVPAARAPLGFTAHLLLAFALGLGGGAAGWLGAIALRRRAARPAAPARPVPSATPEAAPTPAPAPGEDEDFARLAAARTGPGTRRRPLTSETAEAPSILEISALPALEPLTPAPPEAAAPASAAPAAPAPVPAERAPAPALFRKPEELAGSAALRLRAAPLESLSVIQLVERFALALANRRAAGSATPAAPLAARAMPPAMLFAEPPVPGAPARVAAAGRPFDMPGSSDDEIARWTLPEPQDEAESAERDDGQTPDPAAAAAADTPYPSLLDMRPANRMPAPLADFVRVDDAAHHAPPQAGPQPVVVFPGQAVPAPPLGHDLAGPPAATEQALREALAALQRMSGTA